MIILVLNAFAQEGYYPPPANVIYHNDTLTICPPDSLPGNPVILLAYNIYVDSVFFDNITVTNPTDTIDYIFTFPALPPGGHSFCANAVYNQWISDQTCDSAIVIYGYELPFLEDWSSGNFSELQWVPSSGNWVISNQEGDPAPAAEFRGDPEQTNYTLNLESYPINALGLFGGKIWLDFYLKLNDSQPTGNEKMRVQVWNWETCVWTTVAEYRNDDGSFTWTSEHINIKYVAMNKIFKVRFQATGVNSNDIQCWSVDNIHVYRMCDSASELDLVEHLDFNELYWWAIWGPYQLSIGWDDQVYSDAIGTGGPIEFDVAARWESEMLIDYQGAYILKIAFVPAETEATYKVRLWTGSDADTILVDQLVTNPVIGEWNVVTLEQPIQLDVSKDLWVGYHVDTPTGYPAGVDDGPAINSYGNMMNYQGFWQTLLDINPNLDCNWNLQFWICSVPVLPEVHFNIYRQTNEEDFQLYDVSESVDYTDYDIVLSDHYCYKVTMVWSQYSDTCESDPTSIVCETVNVGINPLEKDDAIKIFPNPAKNWLNIESEEEIRSIHIYTLLGEEVLKLEIRNLDYRIDVSCLQIGIFYVMVETGKREYKEKIVIVK